LTHIDKGDVCVGTITLFNDDFPATGNGVVKEKELWECSLNQFEKKYEFQV